MAVKKRKAQVTRTTSETDIAMSLNLDGIGKSQIDTGIPFLDHMLVSFARHGFFDLTVQAKGDLEIDIHHTNEDVGITLGMVFQKAIGDKKGIQRFGFFYLPMDEALSRVALDFSGRPSLYVTGTKIPKGAKIHSPVGEYTFNHLKQFLYAFCMNAGVNMNVGILSGEDMHHIIEATFKAFARSMHMAVSLHGRVRGVPSTKGSL